MSSCDRRRHYSTLLLLYKINTIRKKTKGLILVGDGAWGKTVPNSEFPVLSKEARFPTQHGLNHSYPLTALMTQHSKGSIDYFSLISGVHIINQVKSLVNINTQKFLLRIKINTNTLIDERGLR
ncbi:hypothetical protein [uncultured Nostoc sp.]|uniref:hypothetical protein n=1 Tax=uncultured Nostoc sp. TaxID=340711 RepID=UPI0035CAA237